MKDCALCERPVKPQEKLTNGELIWHSFCFRCYQCGNNADPRTARIIENKIYCPEHVFDPVDNPLINHLNYYVEEMTNKYEKGRIIADVLLKRNEDYDLKNKSTAIIDIIDYFINHPDIRVQWHKDLDPFQIDFLCKQGFTVNKLPYDEINNARNPWKISF